MYTQIFEEISGKNEVSFFCKMDKALIRAGHIMLIHVPKKNGREEALERIALILLNGNSILSTLHTALGYFEKYAHLAPIIRNLSIFDSSTVVVMNRPSIARLRSYIRDTYCWLRFLKFAGYLDFELESVFWEFLTI